MPAIPASAEGPEHDPSEHEVARWCRLLRAHGIPADPEDLELSVPDVVVPKRLRGATLVHVGAGAPAHRWPAERWSAIVRDLIERGERVVITAGAHEEAEAQRIAAQAGLPATHVLAGRTTLLELAALVAAAGRVLSTDTGVAHLAAAYRVPSLVLFGPSSPIVWGPPRRPWHRVLWAGSTGDANAATVDPGLLRITPDDVRAALAHLASCGPPRSR